MPSQPDIQSVPPNYPSTRHSTHSLSHSPSIPQILAYILICSQVLIFFLCLHPLCDNITIMIIYIVFGVIMMINAIWCSLSNPTDLIVYHYKWSKHDKTIKFEPNYNENYYCQFCESFCSLKSKHCRICNRCTSEFDHHCIWINNCVGSKNYKSFILLIFSTFLHIVVWIVGASIVTNQWIKGYQNQKGQNQIGMFIAIWVMLALLIIAGAFLSQLVILHVYLIVRGITTYEFLQQRRRQEETKKNTKKQPHLESQNQDQDQYQEDNEVRQKSQSRPQISNINILVSDSKPLKIQPKKKNDSNHQKDKASEVDSIRQDTPPNGDRVDQEVEIEEMPQFLRNSRSLKMIFGSDLVQAPKSSRKRLEPLQ